jgi:hypothetical protein
MENLSFELDTLFILDLKIDMYPYTNLDKSYNKG